MSFEASFYTSKWSWLELADNFSGNGDYKSAYIFTHLNTFSQWNFIVRTLDGLLLKLVRDNYQYLRDKWSLDTSTHWNRTWANDMMVYNTATFVFFAQYIHHFRLSKNRTLPTFVTSRFLTTWWMLKDRVHISEGNAWEVLKYKWKIASRT